MKPEVLGIIAALIAVLGICFTTAYVMHDDEVTKRVCISAASTANCIPDNR